MTADPRTKHHPPSSSADELPRRFRAPSFETWPTKVTSTAVETLAQDRAGGKRSQVGESPLVPDTCHNEGGIGHHKE